MTKCDWSDVRSGRSFVYLTCLLARAGVYDIPSIDSILEQANLCDVTDLETDVGLAKAIDFLFRLNIPLLSDVDSDASYVITFIQRNRALCRNSLMQVLELDFIRELNKLKNKTTLKPETRACIINYFHGDNSDMDAKASFYQQTINLIYRDVITLNPSHMNASLDYALPCSTSRSILLMRSKESDMKRTGETLYRSRDKTDSIVICVPKKSELGPDNEVSGRCKLELDYLHQLGIPTRSNILILYRFAAHSKSYQINRFFFKQKQVCIA